jgi:hypothetical protein
VYTNNTMYWWISIGFIISATGTAHIFVPIFYRLEITSVFQVKPSLYSYILTKFLKSFICKCTIPASMLCVCIMTTYYTCTLKA